MLSLSQIIKKLLNKCAVISDNGKINASVIEGTLNVSNIPPAALERLTTVANQTARFALTKTQVQNGDTVKQTDTGVMYLVIDDTNLNNAAGYTEYTAGTATKAKCDGNGNDIALTYVKKTDTIANAAAAERLKTARTITLTGKASGSTTFDGSGNVSINVSSVTADSSTSASSINWNNITNKPSTFTPTAHNHDSSYPALNGTRAIGTWPISIAGNAATATTATTATKANTATTANGLSGDLVFPEIGNTNVSRKITWNGSTDGADIYYQTTASDQGNLVLNLRDDANCYLRIAYNGAFKSYFSPSDGNFHGNVNGTADSAKVCTGNSASASSVPWAGVTGKPGTYPPSAHNHDSVYPSVTGARASGTWGINISGSAASATMATTTTKLQTPRTLALTGKASGSTTFDGSANASINVTSVNADTANKLSTARKINIIGNASGSAAFDGTSDVSINVSVSQAAAADTAVKATTALNIPTSDVGGNIWIA